MAAIGDSESNMNLLLLPRWSRSLGGLMLKLSKFYSRPLTKDFTYWHNDPINSAKHSFGRNTISEFFSMAYMELATANPCVQL